MNSAIAPARVELYLLIMKSDHAANIATMSVPGFKRMMISCGIPGNQLRSHPRFTVKVRSATVTTAANRALCPTRSFMPLARPPDARRLALAVQKRDQPQAQQHDHRDTDASHEGGV